MKRFFPPSEYVSQVEVLFGLTLNPIQRGDYCRAVEKVQCAGLEPLDLKDLHETMFEAHADAGEYREAAVVKMVGIRMVEREFPRYTAIPQLLFSLKTAYKRALQGDVPSQIVDIEALAWQVAANGRCLHPFKFGNTLLFHLIENHIRDAHGLPWRLDSCSKETFQKFRTAYRIRHQEYYGEITDAS